MKTLILSLLWLNLAYAAELPPAATRAQIFDQFVSEIERLDGEGLPARINRPESWKNTIARLREEAQKATTPVAFGQVFHRLDQTYPNLHAQVTLNDEYEIAPERKRPTISVRFRAENITRTQKTFRYRVRITSDSLLKDVPESKRPQDDDELLQINNRDIQEWSIDNFIFCKFPYREQCERNIFDSFRKGFLGWDWRQKLEYTLRRDQRIWTVEIPVGFPPQAPATAPTSADTTTAQTRECPGGDNRYQDFKPVYKGANICVYESAKHPFVTVLHIASFAYQNFPKSDLIRSNGTEVRAFNDNYWRAKAPETKKLIIDVIDNGGGNIPMDWYQSLLDKPFQEQYVQFKKTSEFEVDSIRKHLFYDDPAKDIWFEKLKASGAYQKIKMGSFLPHIPQYCATEDKSCEIGKYTPLKHKFKGQVRVLVDEWCISTCTGFVWNLKDKLGKRAKLVGMPDSGDSGYARLYVDVYLDSTKPEGFRITTSSRQPLSRQRLPEGALLRQQVSATRSTDEHGRIVSAQPAVVELWTPHRYKQSDDQWMAAAFEMALKK